MKKQEVLQEDPASWLATFGDLATLLFTFYCLIYASCSYRPGNWETTKSSAMAKMLAVLQGSTETSLIKASGSGGLPANTAVVPLIQNGPQSNTPGPGSGAEVVRSKLEYLRTLSESPAFGDEFDVSVTEEGLLFRMAEPILFDEGQETLHAGSTDILSAIANVLRIYPTEVIVKGHTCDLPVSGDKYTSNWNLSGSRAASVAEMLMEEGIGRSTLTVKAYGSSYPLVPNTNEQNRQRNRRVEIVIASEATIKRDRSQ